MSAIPIRVGTTILEEIESVYDDITKRAYEIFLDRGGTYTLDVDDWLAAERQLLLKPDAELKDKGGVFIVKLSLHGVDPEGLAILVTPDDIIVQSSEVSKYPRVFRAIHFPQPVNPVQVHATFVEGKLLLIAPKIVVSEVFGSVPAQATTRPSPSVHK